MEKYLFCLFALNAKKLVSLDLFLMLLLNRSLQLIQSGHWHIISFIINRIAKFQ